jgi:hypothetical protein
LPLATVALIGFHAPASADTGTFVQLTFSVGQLKVGDTMNFQLLGTGTCSINVTGSPSWPGTGKGVQFVNASFPMNGSTQLTTAGTFEILISNAAAKGSPGYCSGLDTPYFETVTINQVATTNATLREVDDAGPDIAGRPTTLIVQGSGVCPYTYTIGTYPPQTGTITGALPYKQTITIPHSGEYLVTVKGAGAPGSTFSCSGSSNVTLYVKDAPPAAAATNPPPGTYSGTVTGATVSSTSVYQGDTVKFTIDGTGTCQNSIYGVPGFPSMVGPEKMPQTYDFKMDQVGTFTALPTVLGLAGAPGNCLDKRSASSTALKISVSPIPVDDPVIAGVRLSLPAGSPPRPDTSTVYSNETIPIAVEGTGQTGGYPQCGYRIVFNPNLIYHQTENSFGVTKFGKLAIGTYAVEVVPAALGLVTGTAVPPCKGSASFTLHVIALHS